MSNTKKFHYFFDVINNKIAMQIFKKWKKQWKHIFFKNVTYFTFNMLFGQRNIKKLFKIMKNKLLFFTIMQLKIGHEYFKSFQCKLLNWTWNFKIENDLCSACHLKKTSNHFILKYKKFEKKIGLMKFKFFYKINFQYMFTSFEQSLLIWYLQNTYLTTRKLFLHLDQEIYEGGWGDLRSDSPDSTTSAESKTSDENLDWLIMENGQFGKICGVLNEKFDLFFVFLVALSWKFLCDQLFDTKLALEGIYYTWKGF